MVVAGATAAAELRRAIRAGTFDGLTTGLVPGAVQVNLAVLPSRYADDFVTFCRANDAACPVLAVGKAGDPTLPGLGEDIDVRTDCPAYWVYGDGIRKTAQDIRAYWQRDLVSVAIGCWFSMEDALRRAGVRLRHLELGLQGPLMRTNRATVPVGDFGGPLVVSMRPFAADEVATVKAVTGRSRGCMARRSTKAIRGRWALRVSIIRISASGSIRCRARSRSIGAAD